MSSTSLPQSKAALSCDRCRVRKIKCIRMDGVSCESCIKTNQRCHSSSTRRARPYYQTSKEQYELMTSIVRHFLPNTPLQTDHLRQAVARLSEDGDAYANNQAQSTQPQKEPAEDPSCPTLPLSAPSGRQDSQVSLLTSTSHQSVFKDGEAFVDSMAVMRFATGSNWAVFYQRIRRTLAHSRQGRLLHSQPIFNCDTFDADPGPPAALLNLPPRELVEQSALKFFAEVNTGHGVLDYVQFHQDVENAYQSSPMTTHASLSIICLVVALGQDSDEWFERAVDFSPGTLREGSVQSIQAFMLSTLFHLGRNHRNMAWIDTGCAVRIAQSIGLHVELPSTGSSSCAGRPEQIWWSLYNMEVFLSCMLGRPPSILEEHVNTLSTSGPASNQLIQDPWTPQHYLRHSVSLTQIISSLLRLLYWRQGAANDDHAVRDLLDRLQEWRDTLPTYLLFDRTTVVPTYVRSIAHLGLRYYHAIMLLTRPYLLLSIDEDAASLNDQRRSWAAKCESANGESIALLRDMNRLGLLSQISFSDAYYIVPNSAILFLRCLRSPSEELIAEMQSFQPLLSFADRLGVAKWSNKAFDALLESIRAVDREQEGCESAEKGPKAPTILENLSSGNTLVDPMLEVDILAEGFWETTAFSDLGYMQLDDILL